MRQLFKDGAPRYIRCYDNGGQSYDRYTVVFTKKKHGGEFVYLGMSEYPHHPQGFGQHGYSETLIDKPSYSHLGKRIRFNDLPTDCKALVMQDYEYIWEITEEELNQVKNEQ